MRHFASATAVGALLAATPALADITPQQAWEKFQQYYANMGYTVSGDITDGGTTLTVTDMKLSMSAPNGEGAFDMTLSPIVLTDAGDGTVNVTLPASMPLSIQVRAPDEPPFDVSLKMEQTGLAINVSGAPDDITTRYAADQISVTMDNLTANGKPVPADVGSFQMIMSGVTGENRSSGTDTRQIAQSGSAQEISYAANISDPEGDGSANIVGALRGLAFSGQAVMPADMDPNSMGASMRAGFAGGGDMTFQGGQTSFEFQGDDGSGAGKTSSTGGAIRAMLTNSGLEYSISSTGTQIDVQASSIPIPISAAMAETSFTLKMPLLSSDTEQDFGLGLRLAGFEMADMLWNLFDPGTVLPRDPATINVDLSGKTKLFADLVDEKAMEELGASGGAPGELNAVTVNDLTVEVAGARLDGTGAFTFDNSDMSTFPGVPRPTGAAELSLAGGNGLLDKLVQMGLLSSDDAMGARMMVSMFAVPGAGDDVLNSKVEVNDQGHILANGMRIQ